MMINGQQLFAIVYKIIKAARPYKNAQDGSYEASLYYESCEAVKRLRLDSEALEEYDEALRELKALEDFTY